MKHFKKVALPALFAFQITSYSQMEGGVVGTTFTPPMEVENYSRSTISADIDGDGYNDIITFYDGWGDNDSVMWFKNIGNFEFSEYKTIEKCAGDSHRILRLGDLNSDDNMDIIAGYVDELIWYENTGDGTFFDGDTISNDVDGVLSMSINDLDGDGDLDILTGEYWGEKVAWYRNDGEGNFGDKIVVADHGSYVWDVDAADIDGDGDLDILRGTSISPKIIWIENEAGVFEIEHEVEGFVNGLRDIHAVDFDVDGDIDILSVSVTDGRIAFFKNLGDGTFDERFDLRQDYKEHFWISEGDIDNNGRPDIFCNVDVNTEFNGIEWFEFDETGEIIKTNRLQYLMDDVELESFDAENIYYPLTLSDLDNDGDLDLVLCSGDGITVSENRLYTASITDNEYDQFKLYHDPLNGEIVISSISENALINSIRIYKIDGREILCSSDIMASSFRISTIDFVHQLVIVSLQIADGRTQVEKMIIN